MYTVLEEEGITRVVNNVPGREARMGASNPAIDRVFEQVRSRFTPDVIHVQHLAGLSVTLPRAGVPTVWTLHDAWGWCAAGGTLLRGKHPCDGPSSECATCASGWMRDVPNVDRGLRVAELVGGVMPTRVLHRAWKKLPGWVRARASGGEAEPLGEAQIARRSAAFLQLAREVNVIAPSRYLAGLAEAQGFGAVQVVPHGVASPGRARTLAPDAPFVFLGTLAHHKGPDLVRYAWERTGRIAPLRTHGPPGPDPAFQVTNDGPIPHEAVAPLLAGARALVLGSIWPENAPLVILEARAVGCPVIAPAIGGIPEIVEDGVDGWLYPPGDCEMLARCMERAMPTAVRAPPGFEGHLDAILGVYARLVG